MKLNLFGIRLITSILVCVSLLVGCGGGAAVNLHDPQAWKQPADLDRATSDWDIAEGICLKVSLGAELTEEEKSQIQSDLETMQELSSSFMELSSALQSAGDESSADIAQGMGAATMFSSFFDSATAGEKKKDEVFVECMQNLGWSM